MINTKKAERRKIDYPTLDDVLADARRLVEANAETTGNWSLGQILQHIATVMEKTANGFEMKAALPIRLLGRFVLKHLFLKYGMSPGFQLKGAAAKELLPDDTDPQQELERLARAVEQLKTQTEFPDHAFFGPMDQEFAQRINCRHSELHMSFVKEV